MHCGCGCARHRHLPRQAHDTAVLVRVPIHKEVHAANRGVVDDQVAQRSARHIVRDGDDAQILYARDTVRTHRQRVQNCVALPTAGGCVERVHTHTRNARWDVHPAERFTAILDLRGTVRQLYSVDERRTLTGVNRGVADRTIHHEARHATTTHGQHLAAAARGERRGRGRRSH